MMISLLRRKLTAQPCRWFATEAAAKSRSFMRDFYKYVHPDILHSAPERVREENSRSLQLLNGYLDKLKKNEGSPSVEVRFYTPEKTTRKNKRYFFFKARLDAFSGQLGQSDLEKFKAKTSAILTDKLNEVLEEHTGLGTKAAAKEESKLPDGFIDVNEATFESNPGLFKKTTSKRDALASEMAAINKAYSEYLNKSANDELLAQIAENISLVDPANRHKKEFAMELMKNLEYMKNKDVMISALFDPKYITLDRHMEEKVIFDFAKKIDRSAHKKACAEDILQVFDVLRNNYPNLYLVLSDRYCTDVPGFVHIKWNDDLHSITKYLKENIGFSSDKILNYQHDIRNLVRLRAEIVQEFGLNNLWIDFRSMDLQSETAFLVNLRTLLRNVVQQKPSIAAILRQCSFSLADSEKTSNYTYELPWNFVVADLQARILAAFSN